MESELDGATIVLKRLLEYLKNTVDDYNVEWVAAPHKIANLKNTFYLHTTKAAQY